MAEIEHKETPQEAPGGTPRAPRFSAARLAGRNKPIVVRVKKKGKKRKYSKPLKDFQQGLRRASQGSGRLAYAVAAGLSTFRRRSDKSSEKRRDGMLRDLLRNSAAGFGKTLRKSSKVPVILLKGFGKNTARRQVRTLRRMMSWSWLR